MASSTTKSRRMASLALLLVLSQTLTASAFDAGVTDHNLERCCLSGRSYDVFHGLYIFNEPLRLDLVIASKPVEIPPALEKYGAFTENLASESGIQFTPPRPLQANEVLRDDLVIVILPNDRNDFDPGRLSVVRGLIAAFVIRGAAVPDKIAFADRFIDKIYARTDPNNISISRVYGDGALLEALVILRAPADQNSLLSILERSTFRAVGYNIDDVSLEDSIFEAARRPYGGIPTELDFGHLDRSTRISRRVSFEDDDPCWRRS